MTDEVKSSPKLRFPKFSDNWNTKVFESLFIFERSNSFSRDQLTSNTGTTRNVHYGDIHTKFGMVVNIDKIELPLVNESLIKSIKEESLCADGDIIIADASEDYEGVGKTIELINIGDKKVVSGLHTIFAKPKTDTFTLGYMGYYMNSVQVHDQIKFYAVGTKVYSISKTSVSKIIVKFPCKSEQKKIVDFLSLIDKSIENLEEKIRLLKLQKKGIMYKIYNQDLRFPGFVDEWTKLKIGDICDKVGERNAVSDKLESYSISNKNGFAKQDRHFENSRYSSLDKSLYKVVYRGEFAYNPARINVGSIGYQNCADKVAVSSLYVCVKFKNDISDGFMLHYFQTELFQSEVIKNTEGSVREYLFFENFSNINLELPCLSEQEKITQFLDLIDNQIENTKLLLDQRKKKKMGLMQRMFV